MNLHHENYPFHAKDLSEIFHTLGSKPGGLPATEADRRQNEFGRNEIPDKKQQHPLFLFLKQFNNYLIYILILAVIISFYLGNIVDAYLILSIIIINAVIGFVQEYKAERSIESLKKMLVPIASVYRDGKLKQIDAKNLVPGDVIYVQEGDRIPADARIIDISNLRTNEASLTGESLPINKDLAVLPDSSSMPDQKNMVWMGTFVVGGDGTAIVTHTGLNTVIGGVAESLTDIEKGEGHFKRKTKKLAIQLGVIASVGAGLIFLIGFFIVRIDFSEIFLFTLASLVAGIPEGLPAVLAIVLALGARRMAGKNVLVRKLHATETLGHATVIATDKTGTLTQNTMNVEHIILPDGKEVSVSGNGWETEGRFTQDAAEINIIQDPDFKKILHVAALCTNARLLEEEKEERLSIIGDPTEAALVVMAGKAGIDKNVLQEREKRIYDQPFNKELRYRASIIEHVEDVPRRELYVVGAPESILQNAESYSEAGKERVLDKKHIEMINMQIEQLTGSGMRVLGLAYRKVNQDTNKVDETLVADLTFCGIVGMKDPTRPEVKTAIEQAMDAGIRVIMKTGDHKGTAVAIAKEIGLLKNIEDSNRDYPIVLTEEELSKMSDSQFNEIVKQVSVYARITPQMKMRIIGSLQKQGEIVVMTGDGVNDAPALKKADVGISMGIIGTDVARSASDMVLEDDNFASILRAVEQGRIVFSNIRRVTYFLLTTNLAEAITILCALLLGFALPLLPVHILWLNLITDGIVVLALAVEPGHSNVMQKKPTGESMDILVKDIVPFFFIIAVSMTGSTLYIFNSFLAEGLDKARTGAFAVLAIAQLFNVLNMRSLDKSIFELGFMSNPYVIWSILLSALPLILLFYIPFLQRIFQFVPLTGMEFLNIVLLSSLVLWLGEGYKFLKNHFL